MRDISAFIAASLALILCWWMLAAPPWRLRDPGGPRAVQVLAADGTPVARSGIVGDPVDVASLPAYVPQAFLAIEDRRFYAHYGFDMRGMVRAGFHNLRAGHVVEGGSTITQQYAKRAFLSDDRTFGRKIREVLLAPWIETWLSKDEILSRYLSSAYFGNGAYGLSAAARSYFDKRPQDLTLDQAALLAGLVKAPTRLAPTNDLPAAQARARTVMTAMAEAGFITPAQAAIPPHLDLKDGTDLVPEGGWFADWVTSAIPSGRAGPLRTTLDPALQRRAVAAVARARLGGAQVALVAMRPDGTVVAMVGGRSYRDSSFNRATQAHRQPGSTFKLFVYLAALRKGASPDDYVDDEPTTVAGWSPTNADGIYRGPISLREAFAISSNVAAVRVAQMTGNDRIIAMARDLGVTSPLPDTPSLALGTATMTLLELTSAYAGIANGAYPVVPHGVAVAPPVTRKFDRDREWQPMLDMLWQAANEGTGRLAALSQPTFGKTGTTQDNRDALFVGFAGNLVVGVWVGRDDNKPVPGLSGGKLPALIWRDFMGGGPIHAVKRGYQPRPQLEPVYEDRGDDEDMSDDPRDDRRYDRREEDGVLYDDRRYPGRRYEDDDPRDEGDDR